MPFSPASLQRGGDLQYDYYGNVGAARAAAAADAAQLQATQHKLEHAEEAWRVRKEVLRRQGRTDEADAMGNFPGLQTLAALLKDTEDASVRPSHVAPRLRPAESTVKYIAFMEKRAAAKRGDRQQARTDTVGLAGLRSYAGALALSREREVLASAELARIMAQEFTVRGGVPEQAVDDLKEAEAIFHGIRMKKK